MQQSAPKPRFPKYVTQVWAGTFEDYRTRHFVQRLTCSAQHPARFDVESQLIVAYTTSRGQSEILVRHL